MTSSKPRIFYAIGIALMLCTVILGQLIQDEVKLLGMQGYMDAGPQINRLLMLFFAFGFPLGIGLVLVAAIVSGRGSKQAVWLFYFAAVSGVAVTLLIHGVVGTAYSPLYFGVGGVFIMLLIIAFAWYWAAYRDSLDATRHIASDLQALGYLCFALAAWNLCGVGAIPGMALYPEKMLVLEPRNFAVAQMKAVMAFFVLGWLFTVLGVKRLIAAAR